MKQLLLATILLFVPHIGMATDGVFDVHVHVRDGDASVRAYRAQVEGAGVALSGFGAIFIADAGQPARTREKNDELLSLARTHPGLMPIGSVHPYDGDAALAELQRIAGLGMKAIKLHAHTQKIDPADPRVLALCRRAGELGLVVLFDHAGITPGEPEKLFDLAIKASGTRFVFTHMGALGFRFWNLLPLARTAEGLLADNFHFDLSAIVTLVADSPLEEEFVWTMRNIGIDRLLLGSDFPQFTLAQTLDALDRLDLTEEEKAKIRNGNAQALFFGKDG
jgi:uncharacterized protein